jgi:hypothetical protein
MVVLVHEAATFLRKMSNRRGGGERVRQRIHRRLVIEARFTDDDKTTMTTAAASATAAAAAMSTRRASTDGSKPHSPRRASTGGSEPLSPRQQRFSMCDMREVEARVHTFSQKRGEVGIDSFLLLVTLLFEATVLTNKSHAFVQGMATVRASFGFRLTDEGAAKAIQFHAKRWLAYSTLRNNQSSASQLLEYPAANVLEHEPAADGAISMPNAVDAAPTLDAAPAVGGVTPDEPREQTAAPTTSSGRDQAPR